MLQVVAVDTSQAWNMLTTLDWLAPSWDMVILLFIAVASVIYGISLGRDRLLVLIVSIYMALGIVSYVPYLSRLSADVSINDAFAIRSSVFVGLVVLLFFFISHTALIKTLAFSPEQGRIWQIIIFSLLHAGLLVSAIMSFVPAEASGWLSPLMKGAFLSDPARAFWVLLPVLAMAIIGRIGRRRYVDE